MTFFKNCDIIKVLKKESGKVTLSNEQLNVVKAKQSQIAVIGPPGTGKTRVLTERIKHLLDSGVPQNTMAAITFTNFAANEMRNRLPNAEQMFIGTMHSYAAQILLKNGIIIDMEEMAEKNDFSKLIDMVLENNLVIPEVDYLFVDEVQDLCYNEFNFVLKINPNHLFLCGDADQCIYQFKGARPRLFTSYCKSPDTTTYTLTKNFRSGQNIIDYANYFVMNLPDRINVPVTGNVIDRGHVIKTDFDDAFYNLLMDKNYGSWFILTRTNAELDFIAKKLEEYNVPCTSFRQGDFTNEEIENFVKNDDVKLLTIHSAKGLETDNVIVVGAKGWNNEEKCIEYVAATRARKRLYWCPTVVRAQVRRKNTANNTKPVGIRWE